MGHTVYFNGIIISRNYNKESNLWKIKIESKSRVELTLTSQGLTTYRWLKQRPVFLNTGWNSQPFAIV